MCIRDRYKRLRPGDPPTLENARNLIESLLFNPRRYDLAKVGRYKLNKNLWERDNRPETRAKMPDVKVRVLLPDDIFKIVERIIQLNNNVPGLHADDIDHLGNRRVRTVGEPVSYTHLDVYKRQIIAFTIQTVGQCEHQTRLIFNEQNPLLHDYLFNV